MTIERSPFHEALSDIFGQVEIRKEEILFDSLIKSKDQETFTKMAEQYYPSTLLWELPGHTIKALYSQYPSKQGVEMIFSMPEQEREKLLEMIGEGKVREVIDLEIEEISTDPLRSKQIQKKKDQLWHNFVTHVRNALSVDQQLGSQAQQILEDWIDKQFSNEGPQNDSKAA